MSGNEPAREIWEGVKYVLAALAKTALLVLGGFLFALTLALLVPPIEHLRVATEESPLSSDDFWALVAGGMLLIGFVWIVAVVVRPRRK